MFIEVGNGLSVSTKHIEAVESLDDLNCIVHTTTKSFTIAMPRTVLLSLIGSRDEERNSESRVEKLLTQIYSSQNTPRP